MWNPFKGSPKAAHAKADLSNPGPSWRYYGPGIGVYPNSTTNYGLAAAPETNSAVMAVVQWIARNFPEPPARVLDWDAKNQEWAPMMDHPMTALLASPSTRYPGALQSMAVAVDWLIDGNAYEVKERNGSGRPASLRWLPAWTVSPKGTADTFITHYEYSSGHGPPERIATEDMIHHRYGIDPRDPKLGLSSLKALLREIFTDDEAWAFTATVMRNLGVGGAWISPRTDVGVSPDDVAAVKAHVINSTTGDRRGEPVVFSGPTDVVLSQTDLSGVAAREIHRIPEERISAIFGVAAVVVGLGAGLDRSTFNNFGEAREAATEQNLVPMWRLFSADYAMYLLPEFDTRVGSRQVAYDLSQVRALQEDASRVAERIGGLFGRGLLTRGEAKVQIGFEANPADDVYLIPLSLIEVPKGEAMPAPADANAAPKRRDALVKAAGAADAALMRQFARNAQRVEDAMSDALESAFTDLGTRAAAAVSSIAPKMRKAEGDPSDAVLIEQVLSILTPTDFRTSSLGPVYARFYQLSATLTFDAVKTRLGVEFGVDLVDEMMRDVIRQGGTRLGLVDLDAQTRAAMQAAIADGRSLGEGIPEIAKRVREYVSAGPYRAAGVGYRSRMIARTESKFAQNVSSLAAYRRSEVVTGVIAWDNQTGYGDSDCTARDGKVYSFEEAEKTIDHPNGTLSWGPFVA